MRLPRVSCVAALATFALLLAPSAAWAEDDPVAQAFSPEYRAMLGRDARCNDAHVAADKFAADVASVAAAADVIKTTDKCIALSRLPNGWEDFNAYVLTANAAATLEVARLTHQQRFYDRARVYAEHVPGYSLTSVAGHQIDITLERSGSTGGGRMPDQPGNPDSDGRVLYKNKTNSTASSGPSGLAKIASLIGSEAIAAVKSLRTEPSPSPSVKP